MRPHISQATRSLMAASTVHRIVFPGATLDHVAWHNVLTPDNGNTVVPVARGEQST
jgi:hypothetical protein